MVSRTVKLGPLVPRTGGGPESGRLGPGACAAPPLVGVGQELYRDYIQHLVVTMPNDQVAVAGGDELGYLEHYCVVSGQDLIDGISPVLNAFFQHIQYASPGIWNDFTCQDAVAVIHEQLGRIAVLDARTAGDSARSEDVVFSLFLYCSYIFAAAAQGSPDVRYEIGIRSGPLLH